MIYPLARSMSSRLHNKRQSGYRRADDVKSEPKTEKRWSGPIVALQVALLCGALAACGGRGNDSSDNGTAPTAPTGTARGSLLAQPVQTSDQGTVDINKMIISNGIVAVTGTANCGVKIYSIEYNTVGALAEATNATAAVMVPFGDSGCSGPRPVVLYAHGTSSDKAKNMTDVSNDTEASAMMALLAAQGYVVVAPNYTGYDRSKLPYHPYLNAEAQSNDMVDAMRAVRNSAASMSVTLAGQLFITGISQGGYVAMATHRAMDLTYPGEFQVTASVPISGPYALSLYEQTILTTTQSIGASLYTPLLIDSYQRAYGNVYGSPSEVYASPYDTIAPGLLPTTDPTAKSKLPQSPDNSYRTLYDTGNGQPFLLTTAFRQAAVLPTNGFNLDLQRNDLPGAWRPGGPVAMCYGDQDPVVFGLNTVTAQAAFTAQGVTVRRWNLEDASTVPSNTHDQFEALKGTISAIGGGGSDGDRQVQGAYHGGLVSIFCASMARDFFRDVMSGAAK